MKLRILVAFFALAIIAQPCLVIMIAQASSNSAHEKVLEAFTSMQEAESAGGDVRSLVDLLDEALGLISQGDEVASSNPSRAQELYQKAEDIASQVILEAPSVQEKGIQARQNRNIILAIELAILAAAGLIVYRFGPKIIWELWLRTHRNWEVRI